MIARARERTGREGVGLARRAAALVVLAAAVAAQNAEQAIELPAATVGSPYRCPLAARGGEGELRWKATGGLPEGLLLNADGVVVGTPALVGNWTFGVTVFDALRESVGPTAHSLRVLARPAPPLALQDDAPPPAFCDIPYELELSGLGGTPPYDFVPGDIPPPAWLELADGRLVGTPTSPGGVLCELVVRDAVGDEARGTLTLVVEEGPVYRELRLLTDALGPAFAGVPFSTEVHVAGGLPPYAIELAAAQRLPWIELDGSRLCGVPKDLSSGSVTIAVLDSNGEQATIELEFDVLPPPFVYPMSLAFDQLQRARVGEEYEAWIAVRGGLPPLRFESTGQLPAGLEMTPEGRVQGIPTASGSWLCELAVFDSLGTGLARSGSLRIEIESLDGPPTWSLGPARMAGMAAAGLALLGLGIVLGLRRGRGPRSGLHDN